MPRRAIAGSWLNLFSFLRNCQNYFPEWPCHFTFSPAMYERSSVSESSPAFGIVIIFYFSCSDRCVVISHRGLNLHSLMASVVKHLFHVLIYHPHILFGDVSSYLCSFFNWIGFVLFLLLSFESS